MEQIKYAVVRDCPDDASSGYEHQYQFRKFHDVCFDAHEEARRLADKENTRFLVLKLVGYAQPGKRPIESEKWD